MSYPRGWFSSWDMGAYRQIVGGLRCGAYMVEVGPYCGRSICSVAEELKMLDVRVLLVDAFCGDDRSAQIVAAKSAGRVLPTSTVRAELEENLCRYGIDDRCTVRSAWSEEGAAAVADGGLDLVFIDTEHTYEGTVRDVRAWAPKVREGGLMAGHDYKKAGGGSMYSEMRRGLYEMFGEDAVHKPEGKAAQQSTIWVVDDIAAIRKAAA